MGEEHTTPAPQRQLEGRQLVGTRVEGLGYGELSVQEELEVSGSQHLMRRVLQKGGSWVV
jgi:hypothetical protein